MINMSYHMTFCGLRGLSLVLYDQTPYLESPHLSVCLDVVMTIRRLSQESDLGKG